MMTAEQARKVALSLPDAIERDHHGRPSFRVGSRIFATLWDEHHMNIMLDEPGILTAVQATPKLCERGLVGAAPRGGACRPAADRTRSTR